MKKAQLSVAAGSDQTMKYNFSDCELKPLSESALKLLGMEGITDETAASLGWRSCEGYQKNWIAMPYLRAGKAVNYKYRDVSGSMQAMWARDAEYCFFNLAAASAVSAFKNTDQVTSEIVITDDELDAAIAIQCGYNAVAVPHYLLFNIDDHSRFDYLKDFPNLCVAIIATTDDAAGHALRQELALRLGWHRCKYVQYPRDYWNLRKIFKKYGQAGIDKVLKEKSRFMNQGGLFRMSDLPEEPPLPAHDPMIPGVSEMLKIRRGDQILVTGISNMGKSQFVNCLGANMAQYYDWNICIASFEARPRGALQKYLRTHFIGKAQFTKEGFEQWTGEDKFRADSWINSRFTFIVPDVMSDDVNNVKWVLDRVRASITQYNTHMVIIDPWNEIYHERPRDQTMNDYTGYALQEIKRLALRYMVTPIIVAHPKKPEKNKDGQYDVPGLYDVSDSSHWYNKPDIGIVVHMLEGEGTRNYATLVRIAKVREFEVMGMKGDVVLKYNPSTGLYKEAPDFVPKKIQRQTKPKAEKPEIPTQQEPVQPTLPYADN
jgi:twinkle protein